MKKFVTLLLSVGLATTVIAKDSIKYCRPVKDADDGKEYAHCDDKSIKVKIFKGEWFETKESGNADAKIHDDSYIKTDGATAAATPLDGSRKDTLQKHMALDIKYAKHADSLFIKVPSAEDVKWYYVIDQTKNAKIDSFNVFDEWISFNLDANAKVLRVSPENRVVSFIVIDEKLPLVETKVEKVVEETVVEEKVVGRDSVSYECLLLGQDVIRRVEVSRVPAPTSAWARFQQWLAKDGSMELVVIGGVLVLMLIIGVVVFVTKRKKAKANSQPNDVNALIEMSFYASIKEPSKKAKKHYAQYFKFPNADAEQPAKIYIQGQNDEKKYFELKKYTISKNWVDVPETSQGYSGVVDRVIYDLSELPESPKSGEIVKLVLCSERICDNGIWYFKYNSKSENGENGALPQTEESAQASDDSKATVENVESCDNSWEGELSRLPKELSDVKKRLEDLHNKAMEEQSKTLFEEKENAVKQIESDYEKSKANMLKNFEDQKNSIEKEAHKREQQITEKLNKAIEEKNSISDKLQAEFDREKKTLEKAKQDAVAQLDRTNADLMRTKQSLQQTAQELANSQNSVRLLEAAQQKYTSVLTYVPFAEDYSKRVLALLKVADQLNASSTKLLENDSVEDPYHIMKSLARYTKSLTNIDMPQLYTEIKMITSGTMVLNGTSLATYNQNSDQSQLENSLRIYFLDTYLAKFIEAVFILNESCIGLAKLVEGLSPADVEPFVGYRKALKDCVSQLGIEVEIPYLFDKVGNKIDLQVTLIDAGFSTGDILEIENCFVYLKGGHRPESKVRVKAQL